MGWSGWIGRSKAGERALFMLTPIQTEGGGVAFAGAVCGSPIFGGTRVQSFSQRVRRGGWSGCYAGYFGIDWRFLVRSGSW